MNGVVVIDKPSGKTSHDVVQAVKRVLTVKKAGHTGTLDPLATGVLPVCINEATKLVPFFAQDTKEYEVTMLLGIKTDTLDIDGNTTASCEPQVDSSDIVRVLRGFVGKNKQVPPRYSAVKFRGKSLYKWARKGIPVDPEPRMIDIFHLDVLNVTMPYVFFRVSCSKGTYIRSLCADVGERLGCGACLAGLRRIRSGAFFQDMAVSMEELCANHVISMVEVLPDFPHIGVDRHLAGKVRDGYQPTAGTVTWLHMPFIKEGDMVKLIDEKQDLIAIARMLCGSDQCVPGDEKKHVMKIMRVFHGPSS